MYNVPHARAHTLYTRQDRLEDERDTYARPVYSSLVRTHDIITVISDGIANMPATKSPLITRTRIDVRVYVRLIDNVSLFFFYLFIYGFFFSNTRF